MEIKAADEPPSWREMVIVYRGCFLCDNLHECLERNPECAEKTAIAMGGTL
jgi:hypothetical protein